MTKSQFLDVSPYAAGGLLFGALRLELKRALIWLASALSSETALEWILELSGALPLWFIAAAAVYGIIYGTGRFFFSKGPEQGLLRLAIFAIAMMTGVLISGEF